VLSQQIKAAFIQPMLLLRAERLPEGRDWLYEMKFDGYRAIAAKADGRGCVPASLKQAKEIDCMRLNEEGPGASTQGRTP
jgi:hypothetical protein